MAPNRYVSSRLIKIRSALASPFVIPLFTLFSDPVVMMYAAPIFSPLTGNTPPIVAPHHPPISHHTAICPECNKFAQDFKLSLIRNQIQASGRRQN